MTNGFTILEVLIVIGIMLVVGGAILPISGNFAVSSQLDDSLISVSNTVRTARERSLSGLNNSAHGVYFEENINLQDRIILYQGASYASRDQLYDQIRTFDDSMDMESSISGNDLNFSKGLGVPNSTGTITITHDVNGARNVTINRFGVVE